MPRSILVVEDYADLASAIVDTLRRSDYVCDSAPDAASAVSKLRDHHYAAILLAPRLPIRSDPVLHFLAEHQPAELQRVVLMADPELDPEHWRVLQKPFNTAELLAELATRV